MRCPSCGFENPAGVKFCHHCGSSFKNRCPSCESENPPDAKFCGACGTTLGVEEKHPAAKSRKRKGTTGAKKMRRPAASPTTANGGRGGGEKKGALRGQIGQRSSPYFSNGSPAINSR